MIWFGTWINTIKLLVERQKEFYSFSTRNNWVSARIDIGRALRHVFLSWGNSYYEMIGSTGNLMGEHHYSFMWFVATHALNTRKLIVAVAPFHRFVARTRSLNGVEAVRISTFSTNSSKFRRYELWSLDVLGSAWQRRW